MQEVLLIDEKQLRQEHTKVWSKVGTVPIFAYFSTYTVTQASYSLYLTF